jgi:hypothetical protein
VAKGGIEPPTRGFSIRWKFDSSESLYVDFVNHINVLRHRIAVGRLIRIDPSGEFSLTSALTSRPYLLT